jgi:3-hexulose-6-phosphate synthase
VSSSDSLPTRGAVLQLALDHSFLSENAPLVDRLRDRLDRVEVGTPLLLGEGVAALERVRTMIMPTTVLVADTKICDAGARMASAAFSAGADVVTVVAAAIDAQTWDGVVNAAASSGARKPGILIDAIGWRTDRATVADWCARAAARDVAVEVCVHRPKVDPPSFDRLIVEARVQGASSVSYAVAGRLSTGSIAPAIAAGFSTLIVGGAIADSTDPLVKWEELLAEIVGGASTMKNQLEE